MTEKAKKFKSLAEKRVNNCIKQLDLIGNLSNKRTYHYDVKDLKKILSTLKFELKNLELKFNKEINSKKKFNL